MKGKQQKLEVPKRTKKRSEGPEWRNPGMKEKVATMRKFDGHFALGRST